MDAPRRSSHGRGAAAQSVPTQSVGTRMKTNTRHARHRHKNTARQETLRKRAHQVGQQLPSRHDRAIVGQSRHRLGGGGRQRPAEVPRHLHAGQPRHPRRAGAAAAGAGLRLHGPHPRGRRHRHATAMARVGRARPQICQRRNPPHHAAVVPVPRRAEMEPPPDDPRHQPNAIRHAGGLRRREPQRDVQPEPVPVGDPRRGL